MMANDLGTAMKRLRAGSAVMGAAPRRPPGWRPPMVHDHGVAERIIMRMPSSPPRIGWWAQRKPISDSRKVNSEAFPAPAPWRPFFFT